MIISDLRLICTMTLEVRIAFELRIETLGLPVRLYSRELISSVRSSLGRSWRVIGGGNPCDRFRGMRTFWEFSDGGIRAESPYGLRYTWMLPFASSGTAALASLAARLKGLARSSGMR